ncbi:NAD(P)/FAD-dependent oxidoreductase [Streptomyces capparidis]
MYDAVVVGGGPAGATAATAVAMRGHRVLLLEKEEFPRYRIGESLLPSTVHGVCRLLGVADEVERAGFTRKRGGTFRWGGNPDPWRFTFGLSPRLEDPTSFAYQVERSVFDAILLSGARRAGVEVREGCTATGVLGGGGDGRVEGVAYTDRAGRAREARARHVIDASGGTSRLHAHVGGGRVHSDFFRNLAVFGYFAGGGRMPEPDAGNILCVAVEDGWLWYIPLRPDLTSVGAVVGPEQVGAVRRDAYGTWRRLIDSSPLIRDLLAGVPRATEPMYERLRVRKDYSYTKRSLWRPGMAVVGDAACFVDPVLSSGVHLATYGALLAARAVNADLAGAVPEERGFGEFQARYRREYRLFYEFLAAFYDMHQDERSYFWKAKKVTAAGSGEREAFVELVGGLASGDGFGTGFGERLTAASRDVDAAVRRLPGAGDLRNPLFDSDTVRAVFQEGAALAEHAGYGPPAGDGPGGLRVSADGLAWRPPAV